MNSDTSTKYDLTSVDIRKIPVSTFVFDAFRHGCAVAFGFFFLYLVCFGASKAGVGDFSKMATNFVLDLKHHAKAARLGQLLIVALPIGLVLLSRGADYEKAFRLLATFVLPPLGHIFMASVGIAVAICFVHFEEIYRDSSVTKGVIVVQAVVWLSVLFVAAGITKMGELMDRIPNESGKVANILLGLGLLMVVFFVAPKFADAKLLLVVG